MILLDRTGLPVEIPTGPDLEAKRVAVRRVDPWSPAYLAAQESAKARVQVMSFHQKAVAMRELNARIPHSWRVATDGGLIRHMVVDELAGIGEGS